LAEKTAEESPGQPTSEQPTHEQPTYLQAASEIDQILAQIEDDAAVDIDVLADKVERAHELILFCNDRLKRAETRVRRVAQELVVESSVGAAPSGPESGAVSGAGSSSGVGASSMDSGLAGDDNGAGSFDDAPSDSPITDDDVPF
jgi:exodeoxyribonuclease VII small subunit